MAVTKIYKFKDIVEAQHFLNGGLLGARVVPMSGSAPAGLGGSPNNLGLGIAGLVGKTLIFVSPGTPTVTFTASAAAGNPDPNTLMLSDLKTQIEAANAAVKVLAIDGRLALIEVTPTGGVAINKTGTANALLGFDSAVNTVGKVYAPPPSATPPAWTWAYTTNDNGHTIYTLE
jgi:hypothetical protein